MSIFSKHNGDKDTTNDRKENEVTVDSDGLAFPDIHVNKTGAAPQNEEDQDDDILYDNVAIPEFRVKK